MKRGKMRYEKRIKHEKRYRGAHYVMCEITQLVSSGAGGEMVEREDIIVSDRAYYDYLEWRDRYARGQISLELVNEILLADDLERFRSDGDFVLAQDGISSEEMDARYKKTLAQEKIWTYILAQRTSNPAGFKKMVEDYIGEYIKGMGVA